MKLLILSLLFCTPLFAHRVSQDTVIYKDSSFVVIGLDNWSVFPKDAYEKGQYFEKAHPELNHMKWYQATKTWSIRNDSLFFCLISDSILDTIVEVNTFFPKKYHRDNQVFASWFSGVMNGREQHMVGNFIHYWIIENGIIEKHEYSTLKESVYKAVAFRYARYFDGIFAAGRCQEVSFGKQKGQFLEDVFYANPLMQLYNNDLMKWPYNWKNEDTSGVPRATWEIENDSLFVESISYNSGGYYRPKFKKLSLKKIFSEDYSNKRVFAKWASGYYLVLFPPKKTNWIQAREQTSSLLFKVDDGKLTTSVTLPPGFDIFNPAPSTPKETLQLIQEYFVWAKERDFRIYSPFFPRASH